MNLSKLRAIKLRDLNDFDPANPPGPAQDICDWRPYLSGEPHPLAFLFHIVDLSDTDPDHVWDIERWRERIIEIWEYFD